MGKLLTLTETARRLGLTCQTLKNWADKGAVKTHQVGKVRYVDSDTVDALQDEYEDVRDAQFALTKLKNLYNDEKRQLYEWHDDEHSFRRYTNLCVEGGLRSDFFRVIIDMLVMVGSLKEREGSILRERLNGVAMYDLMERYGLTRERIRQLVEKAIRKSRDLTNLQERLDSVRELEEQVATLNNVVASLKSKLKSENHEADEKDYSPLCKLLSTPLADMDFTVRALNCMKHNNVQSLETVGDLCRLSRIDLLKFRNLGKKTLSEIEDFMYEYGLSFKMDVDDIFAKQALNEK